MTILEIGKSGSKPIHLQLIKQPVRIQRIRFHDQFQIQRNYFNPLTEIYKRIVIKKYPMK
jgi:hypothetical protein